jgi:penicillin-binding protein 1A
MFLQKILQDPAFKKYHGKFDKPHDDDITSDMYVCASYTPPAKKDTIVRRDTTQATTEEIELDENGNPIVKPGKDEDMDNGNNNNNTPIPPNNTKPDKKTKKKSHTTEEEVNFDNL